VPGTPRRPTLADVAAHAGVSATTASYILNGRSEEMRIATGTQERVRSSAKALGYRVNRTARSLRTSTSATLGVVTDLIASGQYASSMLRGASAAAHQRGHLLVIGESEGDPLLEEKLIDEMLERQVDGILYATLVTRELTVPDRLTSRTVLLNCLDPRSSLPAVLPDEVQGGRLAVDLLVDAGVEGDVVVVGRDPTPGAVAGERRLQGIEEGLAAHGRRLAGVVDCDWTVALAARAVDEHLRRHGTPEALVCLNDRIAMGAYQALADHGLVVPDDVAVVSFDGSDLAQWLHPPVTSVQLPYVEMGVAAVELLRDGALSAETAQRCRVEGTASGGEAVYLPMPVVVGASLPMPGAGERSRRTTTHRLG
jgi:LacI family transcriptional regulator